jgi:hypothetical protein
MPPPHPHFPRLGSTGFKVTSPATPRYNCIAWAAGDQSRWWWPTLPYWWPPQVPREDTVEAFVRVYAMLGYTPCQDGTLEAGFE